MAILQHGLSKFSRTAALLAALGLAASATFGQTFIFRGDGRVVNLEEPERQTPDPFSFAPLAGAERGGLIPSNTVTITGLTRPTSVRVTGEGSPAFSINGAGFATSGQIESGQSLQLRLTAAPGFSTPRTATVSVGTQSAGFTVTTRAPNDAERSPAPFSFAGVSGAARGGEVTSNAVTVAGLVAPDSTLILSGHPASVVLNGTPVGGSATIRNGDIVALRATAPATPDTSVVVLAQANLTQSTWSILSEPAAQTPPLALVFGPDVTEAEDGVRFCSSWASLEGLSGETLATVTGLGSPSLELEREGLVTEPGAEVMVSSADRLRICLTSGAPDGSTRTATASVLGVTGSFSVTTIIPAPPTALSFAPNVTMAATSTQFCSGWADLTGMIGAAPFTLTGDGTPIARLDRDAAVTTVASGTRVRASDRLQICLTSASAAGATRVASIDVLGRSGSFSVTTESAQPPATINLGAAVTMAAANTEYCSAWASLAGMSGSGPATLDITTSRRLVRNRGGVIETIASGTEVLPTDQLRACVTTGITDGTTRSVTLSVLGVSGSFSVTTMDTRPDAFSFTDRWNVSRNTTITSNIVTVSGINAPTYLLVASAATNAQVSVNGGAWTSAASGSFTISNGGTVQLRMTSGNTAGSLSTLIVDIGGVSWTWVVTTV